jgi:hypothetical protein
MMSWLFDAAGDELVDRSGITMKVEGHGLVKGEEAVEVGVRAPDLNSGR